MTEPTKSRALACVLGDMDLVRPLGLAGIPCAVVAQPGSPITHSRYTRAVIPAGEAATDPEGLLDALVRFGSAQPEPPVLYYEEDAQLLLLSRERERLSRVFRFIMADAELVENLVDKSRFQALAERLDLPVPATRRLHPSRDAAPVDLGLRYPIIVKPLTRCKAWDEMEAGKALRIDAPDDLRTEWPRLAATGLAFLAQELVPGPETRIESYHVYVDARGEVAGEFTGRKIRTYPGTYGHSTALTITDESDVAALGRDVVARIGLRGATAKLDFKRAPDGRLHLLEINPRFNLWHHLGAVSGVNLPALVQADLTGQPRPLVQRPRVGASWCHITKDRLAAREAGMPTLAWASWMLRCEAKSLVWDDPMPFLRNQLARLGLSGRKAAGTEGKGKGKGWAGT
ncbi:ATP-grasp domain-containing protein [Azospirillum sp. SYSU D00513]|uniref:carboxylate--amine ligase n=1 Tax=Azospirillum sp. SYSU D00513 TaxID=2812561 RepID=UPI001A95C2BB|nr:ATP-grasp domain-containing protein [Azospirillum sp. SYSU D00513]